MRRRFRPDYTKGWDSTIHIYLKGEEPITVEVSRRQLHIHSGLINDPLSVVRTDSETFMSILRGDLPLDIAIMKGTLSAGNLIEVFKLITVFKPVIRFKKMAI